MISIRIGKKKHPLPVVIKKYIAGVVFAHIAKLAFLTLHLKKQKRISLVGHRLNGNLKSFGEWLIANQNEYQVDFFTDDPAHYKRLKNTDNTMSTYSLQNLNHLKRLATSQVICTSHGPAFLGPWKNSKRRPLFVEFWHGAGFKNRTKEETIPRLFYDAVFVSSPEFKKFHKGWGYSEKQLFVTGYSQVDSLTKAPNQKELQNIRETFGLKDINKKKKIVLYAPTWNSKNQELFSSFDMPGEKFLEELNNIALKQNSLILLLPHLNSTFKLPENLPGLRIVSSKGDMDIKPLLHLVDVLITDWSSIYTDFIAMKTNKPVIFIDTKPTFYGYTLTPADRAGAKTEDFTAFNKQLSESLSNPAKYLKKYNKEMDRVRKKVWGDTLDGKSSARYFETIKEIIR